MTTVEAPVATEQIETAGGQQSATPVSNNTPEYTHCASYKEAKYLAESKRRGGMSACGVKPDGPVASV